MEGYSNSRNETTINQKMNYYSYDEKNGTLILNDQINNITINGSKNKIYIKSRIPNIIVNGSKNEINMEHRNSLVSNIIINGNNNYILCNRKNSNFNKIDNGHNNSVAIEGTSNNNTNQNYIPNSQYRNTNQNSNYSIRFQDNRGGFNTNNIYEFVNNITGNLNMNIQFSNSNNFNRNQIQFVSNNYSEDSDFISQSNDSVSSFYEPDEENEYVDEEENTEEAIRGLLLQKRAEKIKEFNIFQFKNWNKFSNKLSDTCAICLEKYKNSEICKQFSCNSHFFHENCLDTWLEKSNYCPLCKYDVMDDILVEEENN